MPITHAERTVLREGIAESIKNGESVSEVCKQYGVTSMVVRYACEQCGVVMPLNKARVDAFAILKAILDGDSYVKIAGKFKTSRQRVHQLAKQARNAGFVLPLDADS